MAVEGLDASEQLSIVTNGDEHLAVGAHGGLQK